jgi:DNA-directed RNA polymerase specialized sigma24 family protein
VIAEEFFAVEWPQELPRLRRLLAAKGVAPDDIEDVIQETALRLFGAWGRVFEDQPVRPLITTIALNVARDNHRRSKFRPQLLPAIPDDSGEDHQASVDHTVIARLEVARTARAMASLSPVHRRVLVQAVSDELDGEQRGRARAPASVRMAITRARRQLATAVELVGCALGVAVAFLRQASRSPKAQAAGMVATGLAALVVVAQGGAAAPQAPSATVQALPAAVHATVISAGPSAGASWWSTPGLSTGAFSGSGRWVLTGMPSFYGQGIRSGQGASGVCALHLESATLQYDCLPVTRR